MSYRLLAIVFRALLMVKRNDNLDIVRAVAVLMVIFNHLPEPPAHSNVVLSAFVAFFHARGALGVDLFFVLSGFLVSGLIYQEHKTSGTVNVGRFLVRRGFKIYPAFYVFIFITILLRLRAGDTIGTTAVVSEVLFVQNYGGHVWSHTWSLAVEEHFYLLLAGLVLFLTRGRRREPFKSIPKLFIITTVLVLTARIITLWERPYSVYTHRFPTHLEIDSLFFGVVIAYYYHLVIGFREFMERYLWAVYVVAIGCFVGGGLLVNQWASYVGGHVLTYAGFGGVVIAAVVTPVRAEVRKLLHPIAWLGRHSYSIYLWHTAVLVFGTLVEERLLGRRLFFSEVLIGYTVAALAVGSFMAIVLEWPVLRLRDRLM